jgi:hypothetical protein
VEPHDAVLTDYRHRSYSPDAGHGIDALVSPPPPHAIYSWKWGHRRLVHLDEKQAHRWPRLGFPRVDEPGSHQVGVVTAA